MASKRKREANGEAGGVDGLDQFRAAVQELRTKSQSKITRLTDLAESLSESAREVTEILMAEVAAADMSRVQALISVVDSILKKVGRDYKIHLSAQIPHVLGGVLMKADDDTKAWLQKMVNASWRKYELFPQSVLALLDGAFKKQTPATPAATGPAAAVLTTEGTAAPTPASTAPTGTSTAAAVPVAPRGQTAVTPAAPATPAEDAPKTGAAPREATEKRSEAAAAREATAAASVAAAAAAGAPAAATATAAAVTATPTAATPQEAHPSVAALRPGGALESLFGGAAAPTATGESGAKGGGSGRGRRTSSSARESQETIERRLNILAKIKKKSPGREELQEIMKVPEIQKAIEMHQKGQRQEAMSLLSQFKQELERKHGELSEGQAREEASSTPAEEAVPADPKQGQADLKRADQQPEARPPDPRQPESLPQAKPADPRQLDVQAKQASSKAVDPRQLDPRFSARPSDPRQLERKLSEAGREQHVDTTSFQDHFRAAAEFSGLQGGAGDRKLQAGPLSSGDFGGEESIPLETLSDDDADPSGGKSLKSRAAAVRQVLQGLPSIGFSEAWLRQFIEQMPTPAVDTPRALKSPGVGRKVLSASGEQMVYVDELSPGEVLLLMQLIFLLEEHLRRTGAGIDLAQRIPHTFSYLQVEPAMDVMRKRFFDELPFQCSTTGLRFASREKLRKHHDALYRRRTLLQQRQRGAEARGWMESIPEWVGNRDLVVGPALFRLGAVGEEQAFPLPPREAPGPMGQGRPGLIETSGALEDEEAAPEGCWAGPMDERHSVCPISGEAFRASWSPSLNDWAYTDVVAVELASDKPLRYSAGSVGVGLGGGEHTLSETAVLYRRSCFFNTPATKRLQSLEECRSTNCLVASASPPDDGQRPPAEDPELAALAGTIAVPGKFF